MSKRKKNITKSKFIGIIIGLCALMGIGAGVLPDWLVDTETEQAITNEVRYQLEDFFQDDNGQASASPAASDLASIPAYADAPYVTIADNEPAFSEADITTKSYESYSELDDLGRCGVAMACLGRDLMPTEERESISHIKPSGWVQGQYDFVDGGSLYNRCHLIGFQLAGENANEKNLITGTRYMNTIGMLPFENMVADYIKETDNHVLYRVTPLYDGSNAVASGVQMEAYSVEDEGDGICFNVYVYNVQPGVEIDYATGANQTAAIEKTGEPQDLA